MEHGMQGSAGDLHEELKMSTAQKTSRLGCLAQCGVLLGKAKCNVHNQSGGLCGLCAKNGHLNLCRMSLHKGHQRGKDVAACSCGCNHVRGTMANGNASASSANQHRSTYVPFSQKLRKERLIPYCQAAGIESCHHPTCLKGSRQDSHILQDEARPVNEGMEGIMA